MTKKILEGSKESECLFSILRNGRKLNSKSTLTIVENRLCECFCSDTITNVTTNGWKTKQRLRFKFCLNITWNMKLINHNGKAILIDFVGEYA